MDIEFDICLKPRWWKTQPEITYGIDDFTINTIQLQNYTTLRLAYPLAPGQHKLWFTFNNKDYDESRLDQGLDMAVEIDSVSIEGITVDRFKWTANYYPDYPADYPDKQKVIKSATYLGWNGRWELPFTTPIYTWIHQLENLGWLYKP
jgi:hypothetical protein